MILDELVFATKTRIVAEQKGQSAANMRNLAEKMPSTSAQNIYDLFATTDMSLIAEIKKASPSKGEITKVFPYLEIAKEYSLNGVTAISVLTEPSYFKGDIKYLARIAQNVTVPILRKDFIIGSYMIYQAKVTGASIILLIVAILPPQTLADYLQLAHQLGLAVLVEAHDAAEIKVALAEGAKMIGVNNRDLKTFKVDLSNSLRLRPLVPENVIFIAESGINSANDLQQLQRAHVNGVLIGETLMRAPDKAAKIKELLANKGY